ncbi:MAG: hypothetical protein K2X52_31375 [Mycobacteriaceae bacterium]|nr:hypothetical protein [Mycobacteriaceae bacterium]
MSRDRRHGKSRGSRSSRRPAARGHWNEPKGQPTLFDDLRRALAESNPLSFLMFVSMLLEATDPRQRAPFARSTDDDSVVNRDDLVASFIDVPTPETTAVLAALAVLVADDDLLATPISRELASRTDAMPRWLASLDEARTYRAVRMSHILNDGDSIMLGTRFADGRELTALVYIDNNVGTIVKDAFVIPDHIELVLHKQKELANDRDTSWADVSLADARVWISDAISGAAITYPRFETEDWPACRALVEWMVRGLPAGGAEFPRPVWSDTELAGLMERFFASQHGAELDDPDHRELLDTLFWYGTDYGSGDPVRWSEVRVEMLLDDWLPRKIVKPVEFLEKAPALLRKFIRFAHDEAGIRGELTDDVLAAVDHWEPVYQRTIRMPRLQGAEAILSAMGMAHDESDDGFYADKDIARWALERLEREVGGRQKLAGLDVLPLPDEPLPWDGIPSDITPRVVEVIALVDACCDEMFDAEMRTACRRFIFRVASSGPGVFRRTKRIDTTAAAVVWVLAKVNNAFGLYYGVGGPQVQELIAHFGIKGSPSQKASTLLQAGGFETQTHDLTLGSPDFLVAARRREIVESRDRYQAIVNRV